VAVIYLDIYPGDDPNGTALTTLTDADVSTFEMRVAENELGSGTFTIRRDHASATEANLATGNYVKVRIPLIQVDPVFGFWLDEHKDTILAENEEGDEFLVRGGLGTLFILAHARLLDDFYNGSLGGEARGNYDVAGYWTWSSEPYGAILVRLIEEGQLQPGTPLADVTIDWSRTLDSDSDAWPDIEELIQFQIGSDGLSVYRALVESGELFVRATPDLEVQAFGTRGVDRTSASYGAGKVRFVKGDNIYTELVRDGHGTKAATHAIVVGKDYKYRQVVAPWYTSGPGRWTTVNFGESNDTALLDKVGAENLRKRNADQQALEFEIFAGDDPTNGRYLPWKHFQTGDLVTLDTGSAEWDYEDASHRLIGFRIVLGEASDDSTDEMEARSLRWIVELNSGATSSQLGARASEATGKPCSDCPPSPPLGPFVPMAPITLSFAVTADETDGGYTFGFAGTLDPGDIFLDDVYSVAYTFTNHPSTGTYGQTMGFWNSDVAASAEQFGWLPGVGGDGSGSQEGNNALAPSSIAPGAVGTGSSTFTVTQDVIDALTGPAYFGLRGSHSPGPATVPGEHGVLVMTLTGGPRYSAAAPLYGQWVTEEIPGDAAGDPLTTNFPYLENSLTILNRDFVPDQTDPTAGEFELTEDTTGDTLIVRYQATGDPGTGATNPEPTAGDYTYVDTTHIDDTTDAHNASAISIADAGGHFTGTDVETALQELGAIGELVINVVDYGATGDGTTDDTSAIEDAIAAMTPGCTLYFPPPTGTYYKITSTLSITQRGCLITGSGSEYGTRIHMATANTTAFSVIPTALDGTRNQTNLFRGLLITGPGGASSGRGVYALSDVHLENVGITGFYDGLYWDNATFYSRAYGCFFTDCDHAAVVMNETNNCTIDTCRITGLFPGGVGLIGTLAIGVLIDCAGARGIGNRVLNSSIEYFSEDGIILDGGHAVEIVGNYFETQQSSSGHAHLKFGSSNAAYATRVESNYFQGDGTTGFVAIALDHCDRVLISSNRFGINSAIDITRTGYDANVLLWNNFNFPAGTFTLPASSYTLDPAAPPLTNPMTTAGDIIRGGSSGAATRVAIGSTGQVLRVVGGVPAWSTDDQLAGVTVSGTPSATQVLTATSSSAASWSTPTSGLPTGVAGHGAFYDGSSSTWKTAQSPEPLLLEDGSLAVLENGRVAMSEPLFD
jgi:hypothetical protein